MHGTKLTKENAAIVINCPTLQNHFKVNAVGQLISFFDLFCFQAFSACDTKLTKGKAVIVTAFRIFLWGITSYTFIFDYGVFISCLNYIT